MSSYDKQSLFLVMTTTYLDPTDTPTTELSTTTPQLFSPVQEAEYLDPLQPFLHPTH